MNWKRWLVASLVLLLAFQGMVIAGTGKPYQFVNRLRLEWDDNIRQEADGEEDDSLKVIEEIEFTVRLSLQQTYVGLRYRPSYVWWADRDEDDTDFHHDLDFILNHTFSPRLSLSVKDTYRLAELPELIDRDTTIRQNDEFIYNTVSGTLSAELRPDLRLDVAGRYILLKYDEDEVAEREDYDLYACGVTFRHQIVPETAVSGELRYEDIDYDSDIDRGSKSSQIGLSFEQMFSPNLLGSLRGGYQKKDYNDAVSGSDEAPYGEVGLTFLPSPATRLSSGASYSLLETDIFPYTNQERVRFYTSLAHDLTARVSWYLSGTYTVGDYDADDVPEETLSAEEAEPGLGVAEIRDGTENVIQFSTRLTYKVNRVNWLEVGWQYTDIDSDMRVDFQRNRLNVGWKVRL